MQGVVKWFEDAKGYGFITGDDGEEYFAHFTSIRGRCYRTLEQGQRVAFDRERGTLGVQAVNVRVLPEEAPAAEPHVIELEFARTAQVATVLYDGPAATGITKRLTVKVDVARATVCFEVLYGGQPCPFGTIEKAVEAYNAL